MNKDETAYLKEIGKRIDKVRRKQGLSFQEMAYRCDIDKAQAYRICKKGCNITAIVIRRIAKGLKIRVEDMFDFEL